MSRVGKVPVEIPSGVTVAIENGNVSVNGPKGNLSQPLLPNVKVETAEGKVVISRKDDEKASRSQQGLMRALIQNMVKGASTGFSKQLEINGVGYRVALAGADLRFSLGFSHPVVYKLPTGVNATVEQNLITIAGSNKQQVGQVAAEIRALKKPEPYKGKGIKYIDERILRKSGKSGKEAKA